MSNPEVIYLNRGQDGEVIAGFPCTGSDLLINDLSYGIALRKTSWTLGMVRYDPSPRQAVFLGNTEEIATNIPHLADSADSIARAASYEQSTYVQAEAQRIRTIVRGILADLVTVLPDVTHDGELIDVCERVILPFAKVTTPDNQETRIVRDVQAPWRMSPEERLLAESSVADGASRYLQILGGK